MPSFPPELPPNCPPADAVDACGSVYRIVSGETLKDADFATNAELGLAPDAPACLRCALSVFDSFDRALHRLRLSPRLGSAISEGQLQAEHGKIKPGGNSGHISWWVYSEVTRALLFKEPKACI